MDGREHSLHGFKMKEHYFDDLKVGDRFKSDPLEVTEKQVIEFAHKFDPQMFHLTRKSAERTIFKGLIASGWHTAAMTMRLFVQTLNFAEGAIGLGVDELRWPNAVRPGDVLAVENLSFQEAPVEAVPAPPTKVEHWRHLIEPWAWAMRYVGLAALFLVTYWLVLRPVKKQAIAAFRALPGRAAASIPQTAVVGTSAANPEGAIEDGGKRASQLKRLLTDKVKAEPQAASRLVQTWVQEDSRP